MVTNTVLLWILAIFDIQLHNVTFLSASLVVCDEFIIQNFYNINISKQLDDEILESRIEFHTYPLHIKAHCYNFKKLDLQCEFQNYNEKAKVVLVLCDFKLNKAYLGIAAVCSKPLGALLFTCGVSGILVVSYDTMYTYMH